MKRFEDAGFKPKAYKHSNETQGIWILKNPAFLKLKSADYNDSKLSLVSSLLNDYKYIHVTQYEDPIADKISGDWEIAGMYAYRALSDSCSADALVSWLHKGDWTIVFGCEKVPISAIDKVHLHHDQPLKLKSKICTIQSFYGNDPWWMHEFTS